MREKKLSKKLMAILLILIAIAIIIIAFVGIYVQQLNKLKNIVPDATYSSEIDGAIEYRLSVDNTEEETEVYVDDEGNIRGEVADGISTSGEEWENNTGFTIESQVIRQNSDDVLNAENYEKTKEIIETRLDSMGATDYSIRLDDQTGYMVVELSENDDIDYLYGTAVCSIGKVEVIDYQTGVVLIDDSHIESASVYPYSADGITYTVFLNLQFDEEGAQILNDISTEYIAYTNSEGESVTDYISINIDDSSIYTTYFGEEYTDSVISVPLGSNISDEETLNAYTESARSIATIINLEELPVVYTQDNSGYLIQSSIDDNVLLVLKVVLIVLLILITIIFIIKYKFKGFLAGIFNAAFIGLLILVLKVLSIVISISSIISIGLLVILNILFMKKYLDNLKNGVENSYLQTLKSFYSVTFPIIIVAFIYTMFSVNASITGIGMTLFWGLLVQIILNTIISRYVLSNINKK